MPWREIRNYLLVIFLTSIMGVLNVQRCKKSNTLSSMDKIIQIFSNTTDSFPIPKENFIPIDSYINDIDNSNIIDDYFTI